MTRWMPAAAAAPEEQNTAATEGEVRGGGRQRTSRLDWAGLLKRTLRDQAAAVVSNATLRWESTDASTASAAAGRVTSMRVGSTRVRVTASLSGAADAVAELPVQGVLQRNAACKAPTAVARGAARDAPGYGTSVTFLPGISAATWPGSRALGVDDDGDGGTDVLRLEYMYPSSPGPYQAGKMLLFHNDNGTFRDATGASLVVSRGPDHQRDLELRDFTGDGIIDVYVAVHGFDAAPFPGAPNLLFTKVGGQLVESAASAFTPYQQNGFTHGSSSADVDCDGDVDIVEVQANDNVPSNLFLNDRFWSTTRWRPRTSTVTASSTCSSPPGAGTGSGCGRPEPHIAGGGHRCPSPGRAPPQLSPPPPPCTTTSPMSAMASPASSASS